MKYTLRFLLTTFILVFCIATKADANPINEQDARTVAQNFLHNITQQSVEELTNMTDQTPWHEFYIFSFEIGISPSESKNTGFIIVSADDCVIPILGYSLTNQFDVKNMPSNLYGWLQGYEEQIAWWRRNNFNNEGGTHSPATDPNTPLQDWNRLLNNNTVSISKGIVVGPLLTTKWNQNDYYNNACPTASAGPNGHVWAGAVATATAQLMKKWNHPATGYGSHNYTHTTYGAQSADFGNTTYDWNNMPDSLTAASSATEINAVATLMYHIGVAVEMNYGSAGSGANLIHNSTFSNSSAEVALRNYFKYKSSLHQILYADYGDNEWKNMLINDLSAGRPVLYSGTDDSLLTTHTFVCDGYNGNTFLFHFNWGNGGLADGDNAIGSLNPTGTEHYNTKNIAIIGIEPNNDWGGTTTVTASSNNSNLGTVSGGGTYAIGESVSLMAQAASGMRFDGWTDGYKFNPRQFTAGGGNLNFTAKFKSIASDTISYCTGDNYYVGYGSSSGSTDYWGVKLPIVSQTSGRKLTAVQVYVRAAGNYTVKIYKVASYNSPSSTQSFTVSSAEVNSWRTVTLSTPVTMNRTSDLYITFNSTADHPATGSYYAGNGDALLWGSSFDQLNTTNKYSWMIKVITSADDCDTVTTYPYVENFESSTCWNLINGNNNNRWCIGTATNNTDGGSHAMYVSNDNGTSNTYSLDSEVPGVIAYKTMLLDVRDYRISYSWKAHGVAGSDYLRVALVPATTDPATLISMGDGNLPAGSIPLDGNNQLSLSIPFTNHMDTVSISTAGYYNFVFYWTNSGQGTGTNNAASIDNILVETLCQPIATIPFHDDFSTDNACWNFINGNYLNQWIIIEDSSDPYLCISNDGVNFTYTFISESKVMAYRTLQLEARKYKITYNYGVKGERNHDYMRVALVPNSIDLSSNMNWGSGTLPSGYIPLDGNEQICQMTSPLTSTFVFSVPSDGIYNLVFYWCNNNSDGNNPPAGVDDILIDTLEDVSCESTPLLYYTDFESQEDDSEWTLLNGNYSNQWAIGSATNNTDSGSRALYISYDLGASNMYTTAEAAMVMAYHPLQLEARQYVIRYDWKAFGESGNDYLRVALVPTSVSLSAGATWSTGSLPSTLYKAADGGSQLIGNADWRTQAVTVTVPSAGEYNLVFYWRNNNSSGTPPPAAIDNISVGYPDIIRIDDVLSYCGNSAYSSRFGKDEKPVWWGINMSPSQLENSDYLKGVMLYAGMSGTYTLNIYVGDCDKPSTLVYSRNYVLSSTGYRTLMLDSALRIDHTQHLWVTFYNQGISSPIAYCDYVGTPQSNWFSEDGDVWYPINSAHSNYQRSWLIKCVMASETDLCNDVLNVYSFTEDFEEASTYNCWKLLNDYTNKWAIGSAVNNTDGGSHALYISNDGGATNAYTYQNAASIAIAYRTIELDAIDYTFSFDWKLLGYANSNYAFMRVFLLPESINPSGLYLDYYANQYSNGILLDGQYPLSQSTSWVTHTTNVNIPSSGRYHLVFYWRNTGSSNYNPPASIDNISITPTYPIIDTVLTPPFAIDFENSDIESIVRFRNGEYATKWVVGTAANNTGGGSRALYISGDGGATNTVGLHATTSVISYLPLALEAREYTIHFDWKGEGWTDDMLRVALVHDSISLTSTVTDWYADALPAGYNSLSRTKLIGQTDWTRLSTEFLVPTAGRYKLVFYWYNEYYYHNSYGYQAAAIDNIVIDTVPGNIVSFCGENASPGDLHFTDSDFSWGIRFTPEQMSRHNFLQGVLIYTDEYVFSEGSDNVTLNIYSGSSSEPDSLLYSRLYTIDDVDGYKYLYLDSNIVIDHTRHLWITFHRDHSSYIPYCRGWKFTNGNWVGYGDFWMPFNSYGWMIKAVVRSTELTQEGDTISYCGSDNYQSTVGMGNTNEDFYWGIRIPAEHLAGRNSIDEVLLYVKEAGIYTLSIHQGNQTTPQNLLFSQTYSFTSNLNQYRSCTLPYSINIDSTQDLWVTFYNIGISYPATGSDYMGSPRSDLLSNDGITWRHAYINHNLNYSWLIKVVTSGSVNNCDIVTSYPYIMDFETGDGSFCWRFVNGNSTNRWAIGTATDNSASGSGHALYISNDGGTSNLYDNSATSNVLAYRTLQLEAREYIVSFDWKSNGETNYDFMRAALVPVSICLSSDALWSSLPAGHIPVDGNTRLSDQLVWNTHAEHVSIPSAGAYNLVFYWHNDDNTGSNPPAAVDNIRVDTVQQPPQITISGSDYVRQGITTTYSANVNQAAVVTWSIEGADPSIATGDTVTVSWSAEGTYNVVATATNINGSSSDTMTVTVWNCTNVSTNETQIIEYCNLPYLWNNIEIDTTGDYVATLMTSLGCDSVVYLHLTVNYSNTGDTTAVACDSFDWYEHVGITQSGDYTHTFTNAAGCDSVVTLHLTIGDSNTGDTIAVACDSFDWYEHTNLTQSGDYTHTFSNAAGCDFVMTLHLTINYSNTGDTTAVACDSFDWYEHVGITQSGDYTHTFTNAAGCDSVVTLHLTTHYTDYLDFTENECSTYIWNDSVYTVSGNYIQTFTNINGCDSIVTLHLTIGDSNTGDTIAVACNSFDWYEHTNLTQSGDYTHTFHNATGCDSVVTLHLTIGDSNTGDTIAVTCDSFDWYEHTNLTQSGDYTHTFTNATGCDSVVTLHLTLHVSDYNDTTAVACDSFDWFEYTNLTQSGDYTRTFTNAAGCDSVVTLHLTISGKPEMQAIFGETELCINQFATYQYDISNPAYQYHWLKDSVLWIENVPAVMLHEMNVGTVLLTMRVDNMQNNCFADTSISVQVINSFAPDTTVVIRKSSSNILICRPVTSEYGEVHYRWGYTDRYTLAETVIPGDYNYCLYDFGIDTLAFRYWVETYLINAIGEVECHNRSYYNFGIETSIMDYNGNTVEAYLTNNRIFLSVNALSSDNVTAALYDVNGKLLLSKAYGTTYVVSDAIPVNIAQGIYFLIVHVGQQTHSFKLLKM